MANTLDELKADLQLLSYPCYIIVHGAARYNRKKYKDEYPGVFQSDTVDDAEQAYRLIVNQEYGGPLGDMDLRAIDCKNGEIVETIL